MRIKRLFVWFACIASLALITLGAFLVSCFANNRIASHELAVRSFFWGRLPFDSNAWKQILTDGQGANTNLQIRGQMLFSLIRTRHLIGMPKQEVTQLLGTPDKPQNGYEIGCHTGMGIDPDVFYITFDEFDTLRDYRVEQQ